MAYRPDASSPWQISDLTDFSVGAWEPSLDYDLWRGDRKLNIYVQQTDQGDGERVTTTPPQPVYILSVEK